jgi:hypothetical protein
MHELNHINGKGDKERSPGWRDNLDSVSGFGHCTGFVRVNAARIRKSYPSYPTAAERGGAGPGDHCDHDNQPVTCCTGTSYSAGECICECRGS